MGWIPVARQIEPIAGLAPFLLGGGSHWRAGYIAERFAEVAEVPVSEDDAPIATVEFQFDEVQSGPVAFEALQAISSLAQRRLEPMVIRRSDPWSDLRTLIESWRELPDGWGDEESVRPSEQVLTFSALFVARAARAKVVPPQPFITDDGEIGFRWRKDDGFASICFLPCEETTLFCRAPGGRRAFDVHMEGFPEGHLAQFFAELGHFGE